MNAFRQGAKATLAAVCLSGVLPVAARASDAPDAVDAAAPDQTWAIHGQATFVQQGNLAFRSPYRGPNSLDPVALGRETTDATLYLGYRPWRGAEVWIAAEIDQGFGLSDTLGVAGFPSGEAYKVGAVHPYGRIQKTFLRQTIDLGGEGEAVDADLDQLRGRRSADRLVLTVGKFAVTDIFDANDYAHDPRHDFLNWSVIDNGTFDYAADSWGYSYGVAAELWLGGWTVRLGVFDMSDVPNSPALEDDFSEFQLIGEAERRYRLVNRPGKIEITGFLTRARMGTFADAIARAQIVGGPADIAAVRHYRSRPGVSVNLQQELTGELGLFAHAGIADGSKETYEFSDIDQSLAVGLSLKGARWGRGGDTVGLAFVVDQISREHQLFLAAGGLGILVGDGRLPHPGSERIVETYYNIAVVKALHLTFDYQFVDNPAYNRDRGPVSVFAARVHTQF
jgi:high affinity Mn2+ porin